MIGNISGIMIRQFKHWKLNMPKLLDDLYWFFLIIIMTVDYGKSTVAQMLS